VQVEENYKNIYVSSVWGCHNRTDKDSGSYTKIQQDATVYQNLLLHIYMKLNMFRAMHRPSSEA